MMAVTHPDSHLHRDEAEGGRRWRHHALWLIPLGALVALAVWGAVGFNQSQEPAPMLSAPAEISTPAEGVGATAEADLRPAN